MPFGHLADRKGHSYMTGGDERRMVLRKDGKRGWYCQIGPCDWLDNGKDSPIVENVVSLDRLKPAFHFTCCYFQCF